MEVWTMPFRRFRNPHAVLLLIALAGLAASAVAQGTKADYERAAGLRKLTQGKVFKTRVVPHWFDGNDRFWYRNDLSGGKREFILVDAAKGTRIPAFDHSKLAQALGAAIQKKVGADELPITALDFGAVAGSVVLSAEKKVWEWNPAAGTLKERPDLKLTLQSLPKAMPWSRSRSGG